MLSSLRLQVKIFLPFLDCHINVHCSLMKRVRSNWYESGSTRYILKKKMTNSVPNYDISIFWLFSCYCIKTLSIAKAFITNCIESKTKTILKKTKNKQSRLAKCSNKFSWYTNNGSLQLRGTSKISQTQWVPFNLI